MHEQFMQKEQTWKNKLGLLHIQDGIQQQQDF